MEGEERHSSHCDEEMMRTSEGEDINVDEAERYLRELVLPAGEILRHHFLSARLDSYKKGLDITTQADIEVDAFLRQNLQEVYPQSSFLTEETAPNEYSSYHDVNNLWVIDPLDGTINFSRGDEYFALSIALVRHGQPQLAMIHAPMQHKTYWAHADDDGAYLDGSPIHVSTSSALDEAVIYTSWSHNVEERQRTAQRVIPLNQRVRHLQIRGSTVADLASLAEGKFESFIISGVKPWDVAAGGLLVQKAGGTVTTMDGDAWNIFAPDIFASNGTIHTHLLNLLQSSS